MGGLCAGQAAAGPRPWSLCPPARALPEVRPPCSPPRARGPLVAIAAGVLRSPKCLSSQQTPSPGAHSLLSCSDREDPLGALYVATGSVFVDGETEAGGWQVSWVEPGGTWGGAGSVGAEVGASAPGRAQRPHSAPREEGVRLLDGKSPASLRSCCPQISAAHLGGGGRGAGQPQTQGPDGGEGQSPAGLSTGHGVRLPCQAPGRRKGGTAGFHQRWFSCSNVVRANVGLSSE